MTTIVAIKSNDGVVLASDKRASKGFFVGSKDVQKIYQLDDSLAAAIAGLLSDAEYLVNLAKAERRLVSISRGFPLDVRESAKLIANIAYRGLKAYQPFYAELLVAGIDSKGTHIYSADASGSLIEEEFASSGSGSPVAYGVLEGGYRNDLNMDAAEQLAERAVRAAKKRDPGSGNGVDIFAIPIKGTASKVSKPVN